MYFSWLSESPIFSGEFPGEGAFSAAFVPVFTDYRSHRPAAETERFLQLLLGRFGLILLVASLIGVLTAPLLVALIAPGFLQQPEKYQLAVNATRITFPYIFFISLVAMAAGMLNTCGRFAAPAATPILLNLCLIAAALLLAPWFLDAPIALAVGVVLAGLLQLLFQIPFVRREKLTIRPRIISRRGDEIATAGVGQVFRLILPAIFGVSVAQINVLVNTLLASFLVTGSISWLYYSDRLMEFPVGVFGIALATAILPNLSRKQTAGATESGFNEKFSGTIDWAARWVCLICTPAMVGLIALAGPLIATIYFHGGFTANGVYMASASLVAFALGLPAIVLVKILAPGFYARKNTKTPVRIAMISMAANIVFCLILIYPLRHVGLALSTSLAAYLNAGLLYRALNKEGVYLPAARLGKFPAQNLRGRGRHGRAALVGLRRHRRLAGDERVGAGAETDFLGGPRRRAVFWRLARGGHAPALDVACRGRLVTTNRQEDHATDSIDTLPRPADRRLRAYHRQLRRGAYRPPGNPARPQDTVGATAPAAGGDDLRPASRRILSRRFVLGPADHHLDALFRAAGMRRRHHAHPQIRSCSVAYPRGRIHPRLPGRTAQGQIPVDRR